MELRLKMYIRNKKINLYQKKNIYIGLGVSPELLTQEVKKKSTANKEL